MHNYGTNIQYIRKIRKCEIIHLPKKKKGTILLVIKLHTEQFLFDKYVGGWTATKWNWKFWQETEGGTSLQSILGHVL